MGFILVMVGFVIGFGVIWKFFYVVGISGGGVFLFVFILFMILIGLLFLFVEFIIGRKI